MIVIKFPAGLARCLEAKHESTSGITHAEVVVCTCSGSHPLPSYIYRAPCRHRNSRSKNYWNCLQSQGQLQRWCKAQIYVHAKGLQNSSFVKGSFQGRYLNVLEKNRFGMYWFTYVLVHVTGKPALDIENARTLKTTVTRTPRGSLLSPDTQLYITQNKPQNYSIYILYTCPVSYNDNGPPSSASLLHVN